MNASLQVLLDIIQQSAQINDVDKAVIEKAVKAADKELEIALFKLDRTEKVKRTTAILLEETIEELEQKRKAVEESHAALQKSMEELKAAQAQLIQSEKMASLGELTAGIAHEIQNPLNFVNNFSEVSRELIDELQEERQKAKDERDEDLEEEILSDIRQNLEKINHHGKRADGIVKGMLQHSRTSRGQKEQTDINVLCDEYLRLSYHGLRAKDKSGSAPRFNVKFETDFDVALPKINIVPQEIGRVILNLINNAFYAVNERAGRLATGRRADGGRPSGHLASDALYRPTVTVSTKRTDNSAEIIVSDNGSGIPQNIMDKIFQPFFTTKPTGQGTGLGLSLAYESVRAHGGELKVQTRADDENPGTMFTIILPFKTN